MIFDYNDGAFLFHVSDNMAMDTNGDMMMRMGEGMAMNMATGEIHFTSMWSNKDEDDE